MRRHRRRLLAVVPEDADDRDGPNSGGAEELASLLTERRAAVEARVHSLRREREDIVASTALVATDDEHDPEGATIAFEREQTAALLGQAEAQLRELDAALQRIQSGRYGRCERCGGEIAPGRLQARPGATTCIGCATRG
jgi:RNA polymerase-binding transcription factor DksA